MKRILCYGDSNTWGFIPGTGERYPADVRWPGVLAALLGRGVHVVENGINGRTTAIDDPGYPCRNGKEGLGYALLAEKPFDLVILMLGTNDLKLTDAAGAARGAGELIALLQGANERFPGRTPVFPGKPEILLVSPILIGVNADPEGQFFTRAESLRFAAEYKAVARAAGVHFLDAARYAEPSPEEGTHLPPEGHAALAQAVAEKVRGIFGNTLTAL